MVICFHDEAIIRSWHQTWSIQTPRDCVRSTGTKCHEVAQPAYNDDEPHPHQQIIWYKPLGAPPKNSKVHQPGIEPGSHRWQRCILPLDHWCQCLSISSHISFLENAHCVSGQFPILHFTLSSCIENSPCFCTFGIWFLPRRWGARTQVKLKAFTSQPALSMSVLEALRAGYFFQFLTSLPASQSSILWNGGLWGG